MHSRKKIKRVETLPKGIVDKCKNFAEKTMETYKDEYNEREQPNRDKVREDFFIGQLGVAHVVAMCEELGLKVSNITGDEGANYGIYAEWGKNELLIDSVRYRIKAQSIGQSQMYGTSWTFNAVPRDPILDNSEANVIFVLVDDMYRHFGADIYPPYKIKELKFTSPKRKELLGKKTVVLEENLPCFEGIRTRQMGIEDY